MKIDKCGVYRFTFPDSRYYIGVTTVSFRKRWQQHKNIAKRGKGYKLAAAIRKFGFGNITKEIILVTTSRKKIKTEERRLIKKYNSYFDGYNSSLGGETPPVKPIIDISGVRIGMLRVVNVKSREAPTTWNVTCACDGHKRTHVLNRKEVFKNRSCGCYANVKYDLILIKGELFFTMDEAAEFAGVHKSTILKRIRDSLNKDYKRVNFEHRGVIIDPIVSGNRDVEEFHFETKERTKRNQLK